MSLVVGLSESSLFTCSAKYPSFQLAMVTHIVLFKFGSSEHAEKSVSLLLSMKGRVSSLVDVEAGLDFTRSPRSFDVGLVTRHQTREDLVAYQNDPVHLEVAAFIKQHSIGAAAVDFEA